MHRNCGRPHPLWPPTRDVGGHLIYYSIRQNSERARCGFRAVLFPGLSNIFNTVNSTASAYGDLDKWLLWQLAAHTMQGSLAVLFGSFTKQSELANTALQHSVEWVSLPIPQWVLALNVVLLLPWMVILCMVALCTRKKNVLLFAWNPLLWHRRPFIHVFWAWHISSYGTWFILGH